MNGERRKKIGNTDCIPSGAANAGGMKSVEPWMTIDVARIVSHPT
jgi:hypothetical protein